MTGAELTVGVDGSHGGRAALRWALRHAHRWSMTIEAIMVWEWAGIDDAFAAMGTQEQARETAVAALERSIAAARTETGVRVEIRQQALEGGPAHVLVTAAAESQMLVLGSHGHSRVRRAVVGSVTQGCLQAAACPVLVIPVPVPEPE